MERGVVVGIVIAFLFFVLGTLVGSFLNVCIYRLPRHENLSHPPSHCPSCDTRLRTRDLIPIVSQLMLRGRCRYCGARFSWRYAGIEMLTGLLFLLVILQPGNLSNEGMVASFTGDPVRVLRDLVFMACLVVIFWVDYDTRLVQLEATLLLGLSGIGFEAWRAWRGESVLTDGKALAALLPAPVPETILAGIVAGAVLWLLREGFSRLYGREAMGAGDIFIAAAIGMHLGWNATLFTFFFLAATLGAFVGLILQAPRAIRSWRWARDRARRAGKNEHAGAALARHAFRKSMPFGPMLAIGAVAAMLWGARINAAYWDAISIPPAPNAAVQLFEAQVLQRASPSPRSRVSFAARGVY